MSSNTDKRKIQVYVVPKQKLSTTLGNFGQPGQSKRSSAIGVTLVILAAVVMAVVGYLGFVMGNSGGPDPLSPSPEASSTEEAV